jgi:hypothetical protein
MTTDLLDHGLVHMFIEDGFVRLDDVFSRTVAAEARQLLWRDTGFDPDDRSTWTKPVVRLGEYVGGPFLETLRSPVLRPVLDQLVGPGAWLPRGSLGSFVVRFPHADPPNDDGWHVDASFPGANPADPWRINLRSQGRALLMLFLFSDVGEHDAPARLRVGSHADVARILAAEGDAGLSFMELAGKLDATSHRRVALATGSAGTVYLCHPFTVHAGQAHRGSEPRFLAQPAVLMKQPFALKEQGAYPVEQAILRALSAR